MSLLEEQSSYMEPSSPIGRTQLGLAALFVTPSPKKLDGKANRVVNEEPYINKRKSLSTMAAKGDLINGPSPKKMDGNGNQVVDVEPFINKRKPLSTSPVKGVLNYGEHTLIPVMVKMIHSAVRDCKRFVFKDSHLLHMVKLVGAVRNFRVHIKHVKLTWKMAPDLWG
jgi:hypothetical protein